jgi:hypothetical protein
VQAGINWWLSQVHVMGLDAVVLTVLQWVFAISTLVPIVLYVVVDLLRMALAAYRAARRELGRRDEPPA